MKTFRRPALAALLAAQLAQAQPPTPPDTPIDAATRDAVVEQLARELDTRYVDVVRAVEILGDILSSREWNQPRFKTRAKVT